MIPVNGASANGKIVYSRYASHYKTHTGDTVLTVAEDFGVPPDRLRRWNGLKGNELRHGRVLIVYKPLAPGEADKAPARRRKKTAHANGKAEIERRCRSKREDIAQRQERIVRKKFQRLHICYANVDKQFIRLDIIRAC